jgi:demethylmenaquinone methyltransferase/2-methoxy-6-polyprenyl-1,4-benzoquinol methylase
VLLASLAGFLAGVAAAAPGARLVVVDNRYVDASNRPVTRRDSAGDTYQRRRLDDGTEWEVLKNFPNPADVRGALAPVCTDVEVSELDHYWMATGRLADR